MIEKHRLPALLREIADIVGVPGALLLVEAWGGLTRRIPHPRNVTPDHPLSRLLGQEHAEKLAFRFPAQEVYIAKLEGGELEARNREIVARYSAGEKVDDLAQSYSLCDRQVWNILKTTVADERQGGLF